MINYLDFRDSLVLTVEECAKEYSAMYTGPLIAALMGMILISIMLVWLLNKYVKLRQFIKDSKLQKKFQEWKKDNKGLD